MQSDKPVVPISLWGRPTVQREQARPPESTTPETICGLKVHPVANMFPLLEGDDLKQMRDSIRENGQRIPVIVDGDTLLEGRNRARCVEMLQSEGVAITLHTQQWSPPSQMASQAEYIWDVNVTRRHLTPAQRAQSATEILPLIEKEKAAAQSASRIKPKEIRNPEGRNQHTPTGKAETKSPPPSDASGCSAEKVARSTVGKVAALAKVTPYAAAQAVKIKKEARPEDVAAVKAGTKKPREVLAKVKKEMPAHEISAAAKKTPKKIDHPFVPKDGFEYDALRAWVKWVDTTLSVSEKPRAREVLRKVFQAEEAAEKAKGRKGGAK